MLPSFARRTTTNPGRHATIDKAPNAEDQQVAYMIARMREMSFNIPTTSRKFTMCEYFDRPPGECGYAEGMIEFADETRHKCSGSVIKGALNGFCTITVTAPDDPTPIEMSSIFTLGYAVGICYLQWPDGLLVQFSLEDNVLVTTGHDRHVFASFPSADPPHSFKRPSNQEFVVFLEPPTAPLPGVVLGAGNNTIDISHSCRVAHSLRIYAISCLEAIGSGKMDKCVVVVPEESPSWMEMRAQIIQETKDSLAQSRQKSDSHVNPAEKQVSSAPFSPKNFSSTEDFDFALWCMILLELESWQPQTKRSAREESKLDAGQASADNEKSESWRLFDHKMSDPFSLIFKRINPIRHSTSAYDRDTAVSPGDHETTEGRSSDASSVLASRSKAEGPAVNLRCMPLLLRAMYTWQDKRLFVENIVLKGSGYRILIKAARSIKERLDNAGNSPERIQAAQAYRKETLPVLLRLLPHVLHQVQDENWASFSMGLEFAWWLSEIAPVQLSMSGLHVLSCACVLGCRTFDKFKISQTFIDPKSFGRSGNKLNVGTLCLRAFQMLDLKGQGTPDDHEHVIGPLHSVVRQEALPLAIRLLGANFHSQESIVSFSNILTDITLNPTKFLGLAVNLINLLKSHHDGGSLFSRHDEHEHHDPSQPNLALASRNHALQYLQQHFDSCQNIVEVLLCLFRSSPSTFCTSDAAGGILVALQDMLRECRQVLDIYDWCQEQLVILESGKASEVEKDAKKVKSTKRRDMAVAEGEPADFKSCARRCVEVAQLITFEATRLMRLINSIAQRTPQIVIDFFMEIPTKSRSSSTLASVMGIFWTELSNLMSNAVDLFRDHRLPESERFDLSCILKNVVSMNFCCLVCIHHMTSCFVIEMTQMQVHKFSVSAFTAVGSGLRFLSHPIKDRRVRKLAAFKDTPDKFISYDEIVPLKKVLETLIICILLNLAHAAHTGEVPLQVAAHSSAAHQSQAASATRRLDMMQKIKPEHREILNQLMLWSVRGGGMVAAVAALVASFASDQLFAAHRLIVRVLLQKNAEEFATGAKTSYDTEEIDAQSVEAMRKRNLPSVRFLLNLIRWIEPSYAAPALAVASQAFPKESFAEHTGDSASVGTSVPLFNVDFLPPPLQRECTDKILEWRKLVELDNISNEFSKIFGDGKEPSWAIIFQGSDAAEVQAPTDAAGSAIVEFSKGFDETASSEARRHLNVEDVSRLLGTELMIETTLAQRHLRQSMNSFHYFCGFNNVNGYIPYLMEMMPRMRDATLPLLSKIPIPYKMEIVSPHLITGVARTFELEIAAFDIDRKDQVALGRFRVRRPLLWIKWMLWTSHLFSLGKFSKESDHPQDLWQTYWAPWSKGKSGKSSQTKKPWHYDKTDEACDNMTALQHFIHVRHLHRCCCPSSDVSFLHFISEPFFDEKDVKELRKDLDHGSVKTGPYSRIGFYQAVTFQATPERAGWVLANTVELKPWVDENFTIFASAVGNTPLNSIVLHCFVDKKKDIMGGMMTNTARRWLVLFGDSLEWYHPDEAAKFASAGFADGRAKSKPNGKIEFASQDVTMVSKGSGDKSFKVSVAGRKAREFELMTTPTDFEQSQSLKLLLHGSFSKTHAVDAQRWIVELRKYYQAARNH